MTAKESDKITSKHELSIGGQTLVISSDQSKEKIDRIAQLANEKLSHSLQNNLSFQKGLILSLLQTCEEILDLKSNMKAKVEELEAQAETVLEKFNASLG
jgi:hypothetical protein